MKLRMIAESSIREMRWDRQEPDTIAMNQSLKNLQVTSLVKLRNMLHTMGLSKGQRKHSVTEPIGLAVAPFDALRRVVQQKTRRDAQKVAQRGLDSQAAQRAAKFWGFQLPTGYYDVHAGQMGKPTADGIFDQYLAMTIKKAGDLSVEGKIKLLNDLAYTIENY